MGPETGGHEGTEASPAGGRRLGRRQKNRTEKQEKKTVEEKIAELRAILPEIDSDQYVRIITTGQYGIQDNRDTAPSAVRRAMVERMTLAGYNIPEIAKTIGVSSETVKRDLDYIAAQNRLMPGTQAFRAYLVREMLDMLNVAISRYKATGNTVEGRIAVDVTARISKMLGIDEPEPEQKVHTALANFLNAARDKLGATMYPQVDNPEKMVYNSNHDE